MKFTVSLAALTLVAAAQYAPRSHFSGYGQRPAYGGYSQQRPSLGSFSHRAPQRSYQAPQQSYNRNPYAVAQRSYRSAPVRSSPYGRQSYGYGGRPSGYNVQQRSSHGDLSGYQTRPQRVTYGDYGVSRQPEPRLSQYYNGQDARPVRPARAYNSPHIRPGKDSRPIRAARPAKNTLGGYGAVGSGTPHRSFLAPIRRAPKRDDNRFVTPSKFDLQ